MSRPLACCSCSLPNRYIVSLAPSEPFSGEHALSSRWTRVLNRCAHLRRLSKDQGPEVSAVLESVVCLMKACQDKAGVVSLIPALLTVLPVFERALSSSVFLNVLHLCLDCNLIRLAWNFAIKYRSAMVYSLAFLQTVVVKGFPSFDALHASVSPKATLEFLHDKLHFTWDLIYRSIEQDISSVSQEHLDLFETLSNETLARIPASSSDTELKTVWSQLRQVRASC